MLDSENFLEICQQDWVMTDTYGGGWGMVCGFEF